MCDMLKLAGVETTVIIRESYFWQPVLDEPSGKIIEKAVESAGIKIIHESAVKKILGEKMSRAYSLKTAMKFRAI